MRLEDVTAELRPRSEWESVDLGLALVRRDFWRLWLLWWMGMLPLLVICLTFMRGYPISMFLLLWWFAPVGSRMVLFRMSRCLFGEAPPWKAVWREIPRAWWRRCFFRLFLARFSFSRAVTMPVEDLEGLRGKTYRQRAALVLRRGDGTASLLFFLSLLLTATTTISLLFLFFVFIPEGQGQAWEDAFQSWDSDTWYAPPALIGWTVASALTVALSLVEVFFTGAGFGLYLNSRSWLEGWDIELAFRRMANRLHKSVLAVVLLLSLGLGSVQSVRAEVRELERIEQVNQDRTTVAEIKAQPDFEVHRTETKVPVPKPKKPNPSWLEDFLEWLGKLFRFSGSSSGSSSSSGSLNFVQVFGQLLLWGVLTALIAGIAWLIWRNRHIFRGVGKGGSLKVNKPAVATVMGMDVRPESLPEDVPTTAWRLWQEGHTQEAISLLYRGSIVWCVDRADVPITESSTEMDCLREVTKRTSGDIASYFRHLTMAWMRLAYARTTLPDDEVRALCQQWPFVTSPTERRAA